MEDHEKEEDEEEGRRWRRRRKGRRRRSRRSKKTKESGTKASRVSILFGIFMDNFYSFFAETTPTNNKFTTVFNSFSTTLIFIISL